MNKGMLRMLAICLLVGGGIYMFFFGALSHYYAKFMYTPEYQKFLAVSSQASEVASENMRRCSGGETSPDCPGLNNELEALKLVMHEAHVVSLKYGEQLNRTRKHIAPSIGVFLAGVIVLLVSRKAPTQD